MEFDRYLDDRLNKLFTEWSRPRDGLLHVSSHLVQPLRHVQLSFLYEEELDYMSKTTLLTGTLWHHALEVHFGLDHSFSEIKVDKGLPEGWTGTADLIIEYDNELRLVDFKTCRPEKITYIRKDGAQIEHITQISCYHGALRKMGYNLSDMAYIYYIPIGSSSIARNAYPTLVPIDPLPYDDLCNQMGKRFQEVRDFLEGNSPLAEIPPRSQKLSKTDNSIEVKLVPHWSAKYCRYKECGCSTIGTTKIGEWKDGKYYPRRGYEDIEPIEPRSDNCV